MNVKRILNRMSLILVPLWAGSVCFIVANLMVGHWVSLPHPAAGTQLAMCELPGSDGDADSVHIEKRFTFHFLYGDCPCSRRVLKHVTNRDPIDNANERIVLIGADAEQEALARERGFEVDVVSPEVLKSKYGIESAPLLVITDASGKIYYSGGYTARKQGLAYQDEKIISNTVAGATVDGLPLYGCAVSKSLQAIIDPLNLKY